jgi:hypothetical protein
LLYLSFEKNNRNTQKKEKLRVAKNKSLKVPRMNICIHSVKE